MLGVQGYHDNCRDNLHAALADLGIAIPATPPSLNLFMNIPWTADAPYWLGFHDRDLALDHASFERLLSDLGPGVRFMNGSEYSAYLHARVSRVEGDALKLAVAYDEHYGRYFASHSSRWTVHLADDTRRGLKRPVPEKQVIEVPAGLGAHALWSEPGSVQAAIR